MRPLPETFLVRATAVRAFLGISKDELEKLVLSKVLRPRQILASQGWRYFARHEVLALTLSDSNQTKTPQSPHIK